MVHLVCGEGKVNECRRDTAINRDMKGDDEHIAAKQTRNKIQCSGNSFLPYLSFFLLKS